MILCGFTCLCSNNYADQEPECVIYNTSRSIPLLFTHEHVSKNIGEMEQKKTCARCGENDF